MTCVVRPIDFWVITPCKFSLFRCSAESAASVFSVTYFRSSVCVCVCVCNRCSPSPCHMTISQSEIYSYFRLHVCVCVCVCIYIYIYNRYSSFSLPHEHQSERNLFALKMGKIRSSRMFEISYTRRCNNPVHYRRRQGRVACLHSSFEK